MNRIVTIKRHWLATLLAAVCILVGTQTAWADDDPVTYSVTRTARSNTEFTFTQPSNNVEVTVTYEDAKVSLTTADDNPEVYYYMTLAEAIADADEDEIITLLDNLTITEGLTIDKKGLLLDLNGKTLTYTGTSTALLFSAEYAIISYGTIICSGDNSVGIANNYILNLNNVTITCSGSTATGIHNTGQLGFSSGSITCEGSNSIGILNGNNGEVTVNSGNISCTGASSKGIENDDTGKVTVNSGNISCTGASSKGVENDGNGDYNGILIVQGGSITGTMTGIDNKGTLTVTGGTITGTSLYGYGIYNSANATLTVSGGTITCSGNSGYGICNDSAATLTVSGGTITCSGNNGCGIVNTVDATLTISGTPTISATGTDGTGILHIGTAFNLSGSPTISATGTDGTGIAHDGTAFNLSGSPTISGTVADIYLNTDKIITINAALTAPTTGETPVADPWTVKSYNIEDAPAMSYIFTTGFSTYCKVGEDVADPAAYFDCITANITTRLASNEAQFMLYVALDEDTKPDIANGGPAVETADGTRETATAGDFWVDDVLTATTTAQPADGITWQWYRKSGDADPVEITGATDAHIDGTSGNAYSQYTLTADDLGCTIIAKATMAANAAGTGYPGSAVTVASAATATAVVKKDNFGTLTAIAGPTMASIGATIADAKAGVEYLVVADGVDPTDALWALATAPTADGSLTLNQFVVSSDPASLSNMQPNTAYDLYYRLVETDDTKAGNTTTTNGKPVNELKTDIMTLVFDQKVTINGVTYHITGSNDSPTVTIDALPGDASDVTGHKQATILATIPKNHAALVAYSDIWETYGFTFTSEATGEMNVSSDNISSLDFSTFGSSADNYGYLTVLNEAIYTTLYEQGAEVQATVEGYGIRTYGGGYFALNNGTDYAMAEKNKTISQSDMTDILSAAGMSGGAIAFKDLAGTALPTGTGDDADKLMAAAGQTVVIEVTLPTGFEFASDACKILNVTYGTSPVTSVEISLADTDADGTWTAEFTMPSEAVTVSFSQAAPIQGKTVTFVVPESAMLTGGTMMADAGNPSPIHVGENVSFIITPNTTTAAVGDGGYALTGLTLSDGTTTYTPTYTIVDAEVNTPVTLPTEKAVKVTFKVPATAADGFTFTPTFTKTFERIAFDVGRKTYYESKGMKLRSENADLKFYTVTGVSGSTVTVTEITSKTIPANMPFIVENSSNETAFDVYIAETGDANTAYATACAVTAATQFKGSTTATTLPFTSGISYYGFNGTDFILLTNDGTAIPANRCWLEMRGGAATRVTIEWGDGTTAIRSLNADEEDGDWYDINGRKLQRKPTKKGVYILNGQKKVVK